MVWSPATVREDAKNWSNLTLELVEIKVRVLQGSPFHSKNARFVRSVLRFGEEGSEGLAEGVAPALLKRVTEW